MTCVGISTLDLIFRVETHPTEAGKYRASDRHEVGGGVAANAAAAISALGGGSRFIGCVGDDPTGDRILVGLGEFGVDTAAVRRVIGASSPLSSVLVDAVGERLIVNHASEDLFANGAPVEAREITSTDAVRVDMRWPAGAIPALVAARTEGIPGIVDCDHDPMANRGADILRAASHIIFSMPTLMALTGTADPADALRRASEHTDAWVAATAGEDGVYWLGGESLHHRPGFVVDAVDTLGAGDVFHGAFALALAEESPLDRALLFASAAAAIKCTRPGGRAGTPNRAEVEGFLEEH